MINSAAIFLLATSILPCFAEPPSAYLPPSAYSTMSQHSFAPPAIPSFGLTAPAALSSTYSTLSSTYGAPSKTYGPPVTPKPVYSAPLPAYTPRPTKTYLPPAPVVTYSAPKPVYGPAKASYEDYQSQPAHYDYQYTVHDDHFGTDFGHKEERQGDVTHGQYMVLLPDGRRQIVEYVADKNGYRPTIRYEGAVKQGY